ncbi:unnamed protein product [Polarella glacialis]|uniref:Endopeptidase S2P n=1 Tax=Polarella glacialis TaxID=89957 RepID=A0A813JIY7_POLGL|nr:unnamed protein product [Polarella glacialis]
MVDRFGPFPLEYRVFDACGIPVYVHAFLIAYFAWQLTEQEAAVKSSGASGLPDYSKASLIALMCLLGFLVLFLTVLVHELGHCAGAKLVGGKVERILLWPLGGLAFCSSGGGPKGDLLVALAGPITHAPQYVAWMALYKVVVRSPESFGSWAPTMEGLCAQAMSLQIILVVFNLLVPIYPLDCSKVIISLCRICGASARTAALFMCFLSLLVIMVLFASMFRVLSLPYLSFGWSPMNMMIVLWMGLQSYQLYSHVSAQTERQHPLLAQMSEGDYEPVPTRDPHDR